MKKYAVCFGYLPMKDYLGFSSQLHLSNNIFTLIISALKSARLVDPEVISQIRFASRTDRGVGALSQIVTFFSKQEPILSEINSYLPESIRALGISSVSTDFHPRRDAVNRTYSYFLAPENEFNLSLARKTLIFLLGEHNFRNFAKRDTKKAKNTIKTIKAADIFLIGDNIYQIRISSKSFLWQMVRRIVGHLIELDSGKCDSQYTKFLLESKVVKFKPTPAPPENLILEAIHYNDIHFLYDQKALRSFRYTLTEHLLAAKAKTALFDFMTSHFQDRMQS